MQSTIHFLPAEHGDAFILHCYKGDNEGYIVVDGGPYCLRSYNFISKQFDTIPHIDLMVLTHHDDDHIGGILRFIKAHKDDNPFPVRKMWANCARVKDFQESLDLSPNQASKLADALTEISKNTGLEWKERIHEGYDCSDIDYADIEIIGPREDLLNRYLEFYQNDIGEPLQEGQNLSGIESDDFLNKPLEELALYATPEPNLTNKRVLANAASISCIIEADGMSVLMLGDGYPQFVVPYLREREKQKGRLKVDFVKVAHHGSLNNISCELLDLIDCNNYIIPTNGGGTGVKHPDRIALAKILCHKNRDRSVPVHLHFNYTLKTFAQCKDLFLFNEGEKEEYKFEVHEPDENFVRNGYKVVKY